MPLFFPLIADALQPHVYRGKWSKTGSLRHEGFQKSKFLRPTACHRSRQLLVASPILPALFFYSCWTLEDFLSTSESKMIASHIFEFLSRENIRNKALVANLRYPMTILVTYVLLVKWLLPGVMKKRKPLNLRKIIMCYSFTLSFLNLIIACQITRLILLTWHLRCQVKNVSLEIFEEGLGVSYHCYLIRYLDLLDTIFFVLRKKNSHVSFLHVFHHTSVLAVIMWSLRQDYNAYYSGLAIQVNSFVHVIMYLYYGLAAIGPHMQKYLWWKKYLTILQIMQFVYLLCYAAYENTTGCEKFTPAEWFLFIVTFIVMILFINFYIKSFHQKSITQNQKEE